MISRAGIYNVKRSGSKNEKEIIRLRKDREYKDLKLGDKLNLLNLKERKAMI